MGRKSRTKGKVFERLIAARLRNRFPDAIVRRASQAERADNPDVFVEKHPTLARLWLEMQDAKKPTPERKLLQAERDAEAWRVKRGTAFARQPIVVWHRIREQKVWCTMRLGTLDALRGGWTPDITIITLEWSDVVELLDKSADSIPRGTEAA